jgi:mRNA interferase RelE/StbE
LAAPGSSAGPAAPKTALVSQSGRRRLRIGDYRVIYTVDDGELVVWVVQVRRRSTVYDS